MDTRYAAPPSRGAKSRLPLAVAALCVCLVGLDLRPGIISMGPLLLDVSGAFGLSHTLASLLTAIPDVLMGILAVAAPPLARRFGRDRVIVGALLLLLVASVARAGAGGRAALFLGTVGVGAGIAIAGALIGGFVKAALPERPALLIGIYTAALSLGSTLAAGLTGPIAGAFGSWRGGALAWALLGIPAVIAWSHVERRTGDRSTVSAQPSPYPLRNGTAWLIGTFFAAQNFLFYALVSWVVPLYVGLGFQRDRAGLVLAIFTGTFFMANLVAGTLSRSSERRYLLGAFAALAAAGTLWLAASPVSAPWSAMPLIAFGLGGCFTLGMTLPLDAAGDAEAANVWGAFMTLVAYLIAATGPLLVGAIRDVTGGYATALWLLFGVSLVMLAHTPFLSLQRRGR